MIRSFSTVVAAALSTHLAIGGEGHSQPFVPEIRHFSPHQKMLADAVRSADVIFSGVTTEIDLSKYEGIGKGTYSGTVTPTTFYKGKLEKDCLSLRWEPSATGIEQGSNHLFFIRSEAGNLKVIKEIFVHKSPSSWARTYGAYDGGTEATLQSIRLLVQPSDPAANYAATLLADLKQPAVHRQATAVRLACETLRPECLDPLLHAITHHVEDFEHAIFGACRLDGRQGTTKALKLLDVLPEAQSLIFDAIASAKSSESIAILVKFGTENPEYRVSSAFAIREIDTSGLPEILRRWREDRKHSALTHTFYRVGWRSDSFSADDLLDKALSGERVFNDR
jgi:hypothetical protein